MGIIEQKKDDELQQEKIEKRQRRKLKKEKDNNVIPKTKLAKMQRQENWKKAKKNHTVIEYMNYFELTTDQSNDIHSLTFWCYYDPHGNTTRMSIDKRPGTIKEESRTPLTITQAKASVKYNTKRMRIRQTNWVNERNMRKQFLKILEVIPEGDEKEYMFREQQEAQAAEVEQWEKEKNKERQRQVQKKYQRLKQDREKQQKQKQKQRKKKQIQDDDDDDDTIMTELTQGSSVDNGEFGCHLIDGEEDNKNDPNIVTTTTQVLFKMKQNLNWKPKQKKKWQKEKYSRKVKMKKKITSMIVSVTNGYPTSDDDVSREYGTKGILKMIDRRKLTKKKR